MILRTKVYPKSLPDALVSLFMIIIVPVVYWFEIFVVLPTFYDFWSTWYIIHFTIGTFILVSITTNYVAIIVCDTSIKGRILPSTMGSNWNFCAICETLVPPRSWHCTACNLCILKRDHHCIFTSCCIGYANQRYFLTFLFYMFIATLYSTYYNTFFMWTRISFSSYTVFIKIVFPLAMLFLDQSLNQGYLFLYMIVLIGCVFTGVLLYFHTNLMICGLVTHERNNKLNEYDLGRKRNIQQVLGKKWYLVWMSPFVSSELPGDGIKWITKNSLKGR